MRKKIISILLIVALAVSTFSIVNAKSLETPNIYKGIVNTNLSYEGTKELENTENATLAINKFAYSKPTEVKVSGELAYGENTYSIDLKGNLYKALTFESMLIGDVVDESSNFDVISFAVYSDALSNYLRVDKELVGCNVLQLYLMKKNTREFIMFELNLNEIMGYNKVNISNMINPEAYEQLTDISKEHWWIKVYSPVESIGKAAVTKSEPELLSVSNAVSTKGIHYGEELKEIIYEDGPGNCYRYTMNVKLWANVRDFDGSSSATDTFKLEVTDTNYYYNDKEIGGNYLCLYGAVGSAVLTGKNNSDSYSILDVGSKSTKKTGGLTIETQLSIGYDFGPLGGSLSWEPEDEITTYDPPEAINHGDQVRGLKVPYEAPLRNKGNSFSLIVTKDKNCDISGRISGAIFNYEVGFYPGSYAFKKGKLVVAEEYGN